jgi:hypothetical protein
VTAQLPIKVNKGTIGLGELAVAFGHPLAVYERIDDDKLGAGENLADRFALLEGRLVVLYAESAPAPVPWSVILVFSAPQGAHESSDPIQCPGLVMQSVTPDRLAMPRCGTPAPATKEAQGPTRADSTDRESHARER